jgi:2'-5' RNA ligase
MPQKNSHPMNNKVPHGMYYVAIVCPDNLNNKIKGFKLWMQEKFGCKVALKSPAHITIIPPFWFDINKEIIILQAISSFQSSVESIEVELTNFGHFTKRVLYISIKPNVHLERLKHEIEDHLIALPGNVIKKETKPFIPHITIANRDVKPPDFDKAWAHFMNRKFEAIFETQQISILKLSEGKWSAISVQNWHKTG